MLVSAQRLYLLAFLAQLPAQLYLLGLENPVLGLSLEEAPMLVLPQGSRLLVRRLAVLKLPLLLATLLVLVEPSLFPLRLVLVVW